MFGQHQSTNDDNHQEQSIDGVIATDTIAPPPPAVVPAHDWQHPGQPINQIPQAAEPTNDTPTEFEAVPSNNPDPASMTSDPAASPVVISPNDDQTDDISANELADIKSQVLSQLSPLVGHLDQLPEERFRTLMMMIQASDDQALLKQAYEAAQKIGDEKARAQALLDIVNEINYFTQHQEK